MKPIGRLHVLTDVVLQTRFSHTELARRAIRGGADTIQLRQKTGSTRDMIKVALEMKTVCTEAEATFIVNDRVDVAVAASADGVHVGQDDLPIPLAKRLVGDPCIVGGSASTLQEAHQCVTEGADYIGFGPVFSTQSKENAGPASGLSLLACIVQSVPIPVIAIGGINHTNLQAVMKTGVYGIAVISAVCCHDKPEEATRILRAALRPYERTL